MSKTFPFTRRWAYVGGTVGQEPYVVARTLETALAAVADPYPVDPGKVAWTGRFLDSENRAMQWRTTVLDEEQQPHELYVLSLEVEKEYWDKFGLRRET